MKILGDWRPNNIITSLAFTAVLLIVSCKRAQKNPQVATDNQKTVVAKQEGLGGLALYTVREAMGEDPKGTLKAVADIGYAYVEAAGYEDGAFYGMSPVEFKSYLESVGLKPVSTHQGSVTLDNADKMMADVKEAGFKYFVIPVPPMGMFEFNREERTLNMKGTAKDLADILDTLGEKANAAGLQLLYHNHDFELIENSDGEVVLDYLLENCNPQFVNFQMDLYWMTKAGADPMAYFEKYPGRFKSWHVKDIDDQGRFAPVGKGSINFEEILSNKEVSGMEYYFVEQDRTFDGLEPLEAIKISRKSLEKMGFK